MKRFLLAVGLAVVTACGTSTVSTTTTITTPAPATTGTSAPASTTTIAESVVVTGANGEVVLEAVPQRIVSLSATHTEMLFAVGAGGQVVGTDLFSNFPPEAEDTEKIDAFNFSVEAVAALDPDLVILSFDFQGEVAALESVGIPALLLPPALTVGEAYEQTLTVGLAAGHTSAAEALVADMRQRIDAAFASVDLPDDDPPTLFHEVDDTLFSANSSTFIGDIYRRFGLANIADAVPDEFGSGFVQLSAEFILDQDPDVIVLGDASFGVTADTIGERPGWDTLNAVRSGRIIELHGDIPGRWGPRTPILVEQIAAALIDLLVAAG